MTARPLEVSKNVRFNIFQNNSIFSDLEKNYLASNVCIPIEI